MAMKRKKIAIIGHFGGDKLFLDGQTVKTKTLYEELKSACDWQIIKVDTYYKKSNPLKLVFATIKALLSTRDIVLLLSANGMKFYFPLLYQFSKLFHIRIYHDVIGGNLGIHVDNNPKYKKYLNSFRVNWVETEGLKIKLISKGITNCKVIPNFKRLHLIDKKDITLYNDKVYRFCTFSRVMKEKGIEDAIKAIEEINAENGSTICSLDIYGMIDDEYKCKFYELLSSRSPVIKYCGTVPYDRSVETIKNYYALLFPTFWSGEGFPGTVIDAFSAGLPVIATDWNCNGEIIVNKKNGILYPNDEMKTLKDSIKWIIDNKQNVIKIKNNCVDSAMTYQPQKYIKEIIAEISGQ